MKSLVEFIKVLRGQDKSTAVTVYPSIAREGKEYDQYENNLTRTNLNPVTIWGYLKTVSAEALVYKQYGLHELGAKEFICEAKYKNYFLIANRIVINGADYQVFISGTGSRLMITDLPGQLIKVVLSRNG